MPDPATKKIYKQHAEQVAQVVLKPATASQLADPSVNPKTQPGRKQKLPTISKEYLRKQEEHFKKVVLPAFQKMINNVKLLDTIKNNVHSR